MLIGRRPIVRRGLADNRPVAVSKNDPLGDFLYWATLSWCLEWRRYTTYRRSKRPDPPLLCFCRGLREAGAVYSALATLDSKIVIDHSKRVQSQSIYVYPRFPIRNKTCESMKLSRCRLS